MIQIGYTVILETKFKKVKKYCQDYFCIMSLLLWDKACSHYVYFLLNITQVSSGENLEGSRKEKKLTVTTASSPLEHEAIWHRSISAQVSEVPVANDDGRDVPRQSQ